MENTYFDEIFNFDNLKGIDIEKRKLFFEKYNKFKDTIPFDIINFAKELGINLFASSSFSDDESGKIEFDGCQLYSIYINDNHSFNRKIFTIAHELGHYFCDSDYLESNKEIADGEFKYKKMCLHRQNCELDDNLIKRDIRANKFAAELLMPTEKFLEIWKESKNTEEVAKKFGVSIEAVKIRASNLLGVIL
jgi:Zn-dependent peptidase ImmA (M78 family)